MSECPDIHAVLTEGIPLLDDELVLENQHPSWLNWWRTIVAAICIEGYGLLGIAVGGAGVTLPFVAGDWFSAAASCSLDGEVGMSSPPNECTKRSA